MNNPATEKISSFPAKSTDRIGFFKKMFTEQLKKVEQGSLQLLIDEQKFCFGNQNSPGISAEVEVVNSTFFRKACLGGSLGVADSYADGDWNTPELVAVFRFFLQNLQVMDGIEGGWATILNKMARWSYLLSQKNTIQGSRKNIALHYDLGNDFYELMLDPP